MKRLPGIILVAATMIIATAGSAGASTITCPTIGSPDRQATVSGALVCATFGGVTGTPKASDIAAALPPTTTWNEAGTFTAGTGGTNGLLTFSLTSGSWGSLDVSGTYSFANTAWNLYPRMALSFHLGNGGGDPDWFIFELDPANKNLNTGLTSGTFDIRKLSGKGGGFSNIVLWADPPTTNDPCTELNCAPAPVPEPASLLLFGTGLAALGVQLRRRYARR